jgi:GNAT superfamily N-acetyltransferase
MNSTQVRQAVFADVEVLSEIFDQYRVFQGKSSDIEAASDFLKARFDHGESVIFLAEVKGTAVGMAQLFPIYSSVSLARVYILNDLFVVQAGRRKGVATKLLSKIEEYARSNQAARISLNVAQDNLSAQALYQASGWCKDSEFFMYHRYPCSK